MPPKKKTAEKTAPARWAFYLPGEFAPLVAALTKLSGRTAAREVAWSLNQAAKSQGIPTVEWPAGEKRGRKPAAPKK